MFKFPNKSGSNLSIGATASIFLSLVRATGYEIGLNVLFLYYDKRLEIYVLISPPLTALKALSKVAKDTFLA